MAELLTHADLNRATLARQMLLQRTGMPIVGAIDHLVGMQAQVTEGPYQGLWSRLTGLRHEDLTALIIDRTLVRATSFRATLHLHTVPDMLGIRPHVQPVLDRMWRSAFLKRSGGVDRDTVIAAGRRLLDTAPMTGGDLGKALHPGFPAADPLALSILLQTSDILVQIPPTRIWGSGHAPIQTRIQNWVAPPHAHVLDLRTLVRRYLAAYGPASVADAQSWSGLSGLRAAFEELRPELVVFTGETTRELFDLPDAPRPGADAPAPVRFMPLYDNVVLGYADRRRMFSDATAGRAGMRQDTKPSILLDGRIAAGWKITRRKDRAVIWVEPYRPLLKREKRELEPEGMAFLRFMAPDAAAHELIIEEN